MHVLTMVFVLVQMGPTSVPVSEFAIAGINFLHEEREEFREIYAVDPGTKLEVHNANGEITVSTWDKNVVEVYALKKTRNGKNELKKVNIDVTTDNRITVRTQYLEKNARVSVEYTIHVPPNVEIERLETSNGEITLIGTKGDALLITSNGEINVQDVTGSIEAETSNGEITIEGSTGAVSAVTSNGEITIKRAKSIVEAVTSNGSIEAEILHIPDEGSTIETSNGSIRLYLKDGLDADMRLTTSLGSVSVHDIDVLVSNQSKTYLKGKIGNGGSLIKATTSLGEIDVYKMK
jgi:hypothetical protein